MAPPDRVYRSFPQMPYSQTTSSPEPFGILTTLGNLGGASRPERPHRGILGFMLPPDTDSGGDDPAGSSSSASAPSRTPASMAEVSRAEIMNLPPYERWLVSLPDDSPALLGFDDPAAGPAPTNPPQRQPVGEAPIDPESIILTTSDSSQGLPPIPVPRPKFPLGTEYSPDFLEDRALLADFEGGYTDGRRDPTAGGPTNLGITQQTYEAWFPGKRVENITSDEANYILYHGYWAGSDKAQDLPQPIRAIWFDAAVNSGPGAATQHLQRALGMTGRSVDGVLGQGTRDAVNSAPDLNALGVEMLARRAKMLDAMRTSSDPRSRKTYWNNKVGWNNRFNNLASARLTPIDHVPPGRHVAPAFNPPSYPGYPSEPSFYPKSYPGY